MREAFITNIVPGERRFVTSSTTQAMEQGGDMLRLAGEVKNIVQGASLDAMVALGEPMLKDIKSRLGQSGPQLSSNKAGADLRMAKILVESCGLHITPEELLANARRMTMQGSAAPSRTAAAKPSHAFEGYDVNAVMREAVEGSPARASGSKQGGTFADYDPNELLTDHRAE